jgi:hypothetical protein
MNTFKLGGDAVGTSLMGYIETTFNNIEDVFGAPERGVEKTSAIWTMTFDDGEVATIYDYNATDTDYGKRKWHIGGFSPEMVDRVKGWLKIDGFG